MSNETTPAIERAGEAIFGHDDSGEDLVEDVRRGLTAALDIEVMARSVADDLYGQDVRTLVMRRPGETYRDQAERIGQWAAEIVRTALLGADS